MRMYGIYNSTLERHDSCRLLAEAIGIEPEHLEDYIYEDLEPVDKKEFLELMGIEKGALDKIIKKYDIKKHSYSFATSGDVGAIFAEKEGKYYFFGD